MEEEVIVRERVVWKREDGRDSREEVGGGKGDGRDKTVGKSGQSSPTTHLTEIDTIAHPSPPHDRESPWKVSESLIQLYFLYLKPKTAGKFSLQML